MLGIFFVILACFLWSVDSLIRYPLLGSGLSAATLVFYESIVLLFLFSFYLIKKREKFWQAQFSHLVYFFIIGGLGSGMATLSFTKAFEIINPSLVILIQKFQPVFAIILARFILGEPVNKKFLGWGSVAIVGVLLLSYQDIFPGLRTGSFSIDAKALRGYLLAFLAVAGWGSSTVFGKKLFSQGYSEGEIMTGRFLMGGLVMIPYMILSGSSFQIEGESFLKILVLVLLSGLLGMFFYYRGLKKISARVCAISEMSFPLCAVLANYLFLGKALNLSQIIGGGIVVLAVTVIQIKKY